MDLGKRKVHLYTTLVFLAFWGFFWLVVFHEKIAVAILGGIAIVGVLSLIYFLIYTFFDGDYTDHEDYDQYSRW